uniref:Uncharacterized protein n=1 Tax=Amphiprion percula TaxID=161767 RepID=A0A3P8RI65_AMPPE
DKQSLTHSHLRQETKAIKSLKQDNSITILPKRTLKTLLKPLLETNKITQEAYNHLIPTAKITPWIYGTPKIHKKDTPLRPISVHSSAKDGWLGEKSCSFYFHAGNSLKLPTKMRRICPQPSPVFSTGVGALHFEVKRVISLFLSASHLLSNTNFTNCS